MNVNVEDHCTERCQFDLWHVPSSCDSTVLCGRVRIRTARKVNGRDLEGNGKTVLRYARIFLEWSNVSPTGCKSHCFNISPLQVILWHYTGSYYFGFM
jgi:hypothetical protein